jgi:threonine dehydratase
VVKARARIHDRVLRTPLVRSEWLSPLAGRDVLLKLESLQPTGSFKLRGAFNAALRHLERHGTPAPPLVTASAGNHGRALACAAQALGLRLTVYAPRTAPRAKTDAIRRHGAELRLVATYDDAERDAKRHAAGGDAVYVSPYADEDVIAGAGTIGLEILEDVPGAGVVAVPLGGGGLISGVGLVVKAAAPRAAVVGAEAEASPAFTVSLSKGRITEIDPRPTLADGLAGNLDADSMTFGLVQRVVDRVTLVSETELRDAMRGLAAHDHLIAEGAGAAAAAAIAAGKIDAGDGPIVAIVSGANVDLERFLQ